MHIYRGQGLTVVTKASGEWVTLLKSGEGMDLAMLQRELSRSAWTCLAYSLMGTHYHLLLRLENCTLSGAMPLDGVAFIVACGARWPLTYSQRYMPASGLDWKKPSP